jgi:cell division protein FtsW (lipid II flippase)
MKAFGVTVVVKLLVIAAILAVFRGLQVRFGIGIAMLAAAHLAAVIALVIYGLRGRVRRRLQGFLHPDGTARSTV